MLSVQRKITYRCDDHDAAALKRQLAVAAPDGTFEGIRGVMVEVVTLDTPFPDFTPGQGWGGPRLHGDVDV